MRECLLALALALIAACSHPSAYEKPLTPVKVAPVGAKSGIDGVRYSANIKPYEQVALAFRVAGYVRQIVRVTGADRKQRHIQEGDRVYKGQVLARLRESDYEVKVRQATSRLAQAVAQAKQGEAAITQAEATPSAARFRLDEAVANRDKAKLDYGRVQKLFASRTLTQSDFEAAKARLEVAEANVGGANTQLDVSQSNVAAARAQLELARASVEGARAQLAEAQLALQDTALKAPIDGVVLRRSVEVGSLAGAGTVAFVIVDTRSVKAVFGVPDMMVQKLTLGAELGVTTESMPGTEFRGRVTRISASADPTSRIFEVEITIPNPKSALKVGMIAALQVAGGAKPKPTLNVPLSAIVRPKGKPKGYAVFVAEKQGERTLVRERVVELGDVLGNEIGVAAGLHPGEEVVVSGATLVHDGEPVQVVP
jgi:multidrug efflux system membrane fusion protein